MNKQALYGHHTKKKAAPGSAKKGYTCAQPLAGIV
jgi:hypothetical protein